MKALISGASVAALCSASPALAQVTPQDVAAWMQEIYTAQGYEFTAGSQTTDGGAEVLSDVEITMADPDMSISVQLDEMRFAPEGDGVRVTHSEDLSVGVDAEDADIQIAVSGKIPGSYLVTGDADKLEITLEYTEGNFAFATDGEGDEMPPMAVSFVFGGVSGTVDFDRNAMTQDFDYKIPSLTYTIDVEGPDGAANIAGSYSDMAFQGSAGIFDATDPEAVFIADPPVTMVMTSASGEMTVSAPTPAGPFEMTMTSGASSLDAKLGAGVIDYGFEGSDVELSLSGGQIPIPIDATMASYESRFAIPMVPTEEASEVAIKLGLGGLAVSDTLWSMIDPTGGLPRDPADVLLDLTGSAQAAYSLVDEDAALENLGAMPFTFYDATLNSLLLSIAGAEVTAEGAVEFNNEGPFPMPVGGADVKIVGVNGLIGKLTELGIVPPEQAMPAQMMLGMFASPGEEADTFTSRIEATEDGGITANGIPLQ